ncbi:uncharacterized protein F4817DRAFT_324760 [Daldinia loculata]|uniref:uncharacterized protein n=1 Tax=Daldinia loculata TaxID=103429 RepID=UPI0020C456DE|nr:uncharacterized protein F4817DRAFT_324760 [Daldinia loculata]KAI1651503.1 hypothetical protein F4817DRAFT_324760 [Daldinia loculata]
MQAIDMDCGSLPEIPSVTRICLDMLVTCVSVGMMLRLGFCIPRQQFRLAYYWWATLSWTVLMAVNVFLAYRTIGGYLKRRRGRICILRPKIMFKLSGDPVVVAFRSRNSVNLNDHHTEFGDVDNLQSNETSV